MPNLEISSKLREVCAASRTPESNHGGTHDRKVFYV